MGQILYYPYTTCNTFTMNYRPDITVILGTVVVVVISGVTGWWWWCLAPTQVALGVPVPS